MRALSKRSWVSVVLRGISRRTSGLFAIERDHTVHTHETATARDAAARVDERSWTPDPAARRDALPLVARPDRSLTLRVAYGGPSSAWFHDAPMIWFWLGFFALVALLLVLDLGVLHRKREGADAAERGGLDRRRGSRSASRSPASST